MRNENRAALQEEQLIDAKQVAVMLGLSVRTVRDMASRRELPVYKIGRCNRFMTREILEWRDERKVPAIRD